MSQCKFISAARLVCCVKDVDHEGAHIDHEGNEILDGRVRRYATGPRPHSMIYFGTAWQAELSKAKERT